LWRESLEAAEGDLELARRVCLDELKAGEQTLHRGHWASASYRQEERVALIPRPTPRGWGARDIRYHNRQAIQPGVLVETIPHCRAVVLEGGRPGAATPTTMAGEIARLLLEFVDTSAA